MPLIWAGMLLLVLRGCEIGPMATWSWGWVLAPFACAFVWFELLEPLLGLRRKPDLGRELQEERRRRLVEMFPQLKARSLATRSRRASKDTAPDDFVG